MSWESPITQTQEITKRLTKMVEDKLIEEVEYTVGFHVDKEELVQALQYDRDQYEKGYADGRRAATHGWIPVSELPKEHDYYLVQLRHAQQPFRIAYYDGHVWSEEYEEECCVVILSGVTAWMPLPEPFCGNAI